MGHGYNDMIMAAMDITTRSVMLPHAECAISADEETLRDAWLGWYGI